MELKALAQYHNHHLAAKRTIMTQNPRIIKRKKWQRAAEMNSIT